MSQWITDSQAALVAGSARSTVISTSPTTGAFAHYIPSSGAGRSSFLF